MGLGVPFSVRTYSFFPPSFAPRLFTSVWQGQSTGRQKTKRKCTWKVNEKPHTDIKSLNVFLWCYCGILAMPVSVECAAQLGDCFEKEGGRFFWDFAETMAGFFQKKTLCGIQNSASMWQVSVLAYYVPNVWVWTKCLWLFSIFFNMFFQVWNFPFIFEEKSAWKYPFAKMLCDDKNKGICSKVVILSQVCYAIK